LLYFERQINKVNRKYSEKSGALSFSISPTRFKISDIGIKHIKEFQSFNFNSYEDRVKLGQELINKAYNE